MTLMNFGYRLAFSHGTVTEKFLISFLTWNVGVRGILAFIANSIPFFADQIAASYGWPEKSSLQREVAASDGAFALLGILCNWINGNFWTATIIAVASCWFLSEIGGLARMQQRSKDPKYHLNKNLRRGMRIDFIFSLVLFLGLVLWKLGY